MRVLIAGAAGRIGRRLSRALEQAHELRLGDVTPLADPRFVPLDVRDLEAARAAVDGSAAVVHMAMLDWQAGSTARDLQYGPAALQVHVLGLHNMLQSAWEAGVRRFVYVSSVSAVDGLAPGTFVGSDTRHYSNATYGLTKGFGEDLCRMFHHTLGLPVAVLRLGTVYNPEDGGVWLGNVFHPEGPDVAVEKASSRVHVEDVTRAIRLAAEAEEPPYSLVHIVGAGSGHLWDLSAAREHFGWEPQYRFAEDGRPCLT